MEAGKPDYYEILQVSRNAEQEVIDAAYRRLARKYHPDANKDPKATERMRLLNQAFEVLGNRVKRAQYDGREVRGVPPPPQQQQQRQQQSEPAQPRTTQHTPQRPDDTGAALGKALALIIGLGLIYWLLTTPSQDNIGSTPVPNSSLATASVEFRTAFPDSRGSAYAARATPTLIARSTAMAQVAQVLTAFALTSDPLFLRLSANIAYWVKIKTIGERQALAERPLEDLLAQSQPNLMRGEAKARNELRVVWQATRPELVKALSDSSALSPPLDAVKFHDTLVRAWRTKLKAIDTMFDMWDSEASSTSADLLQLNELLNNAKILETEARDAQVGFVTRLSTEVDGSPPALRERLHETYQ